MSVGERPLPDLLPADDPVATPHHVGHRERLRTRFLAQPEALPDYELIELLLALVLPRRDTKPLAKDLLTRFGSIGRLLSASPEQLRQVKGMGEATPAAFAIVQEAAVRLLRDRVESGPLLGNWQALLDYCHARMAHESTEQVRVLYLDRKNRLLRDEVQQRGTVDQAALYPREVVRRALDLGASAMILVHNHPSGDPTPSKADIDLTAAVVAAAQTLGLTVHDHLVIGRTGHASFRALGLL